MSTKQNPRIKIANKLRKKKRIPKCTNRR
uniref:Uncharacterized protein n=1 Tax=Rhizophora mucronata TaxID=61149 RepID=A0A2P2QYC3_RHIMU